MKIRTLSLVVAFALVAAGLIGCGDEKDTDGKSKGQQKPTPAAKAPAIKRTIGLSVLTLTNPFFKEIADNMADEGKKHGYSVIVTSGEFDVAKQQNQVKDFLVKKVDAIVLTPCDSKSIGPAIEEANQAGIPVFTADIACIAEGAKVVCHIATDNLGGGRMAATAVVEALRKDGKAKGKVAIIDHPEVESVILRTQGFKEQLAKENESDDVDIQIVTTLPGGGARDKSFKTMQGIIAAHQDLNAVFAINDPSALGARAALEKAGKADQVAIVGFDGQPEGKMAIKEGKIYADPIQFPDRIGRQTVQMIVNHSKGKRVPKQLLIPTALYRKADAEKDPSLKK